MNILQHGAAVTGIIKAELSPATERTYERMNRGTTYADGFRDETYEYGDGTRVEVYRTSVVVYHPDGRQSRHDLPE